ncbi:MAG: hypothetical protein WD379_06740 [Dehalococcoidia bacterium]
MAIEDRNLKAGTKLVARYRGEEHTAKVVETEEGLRYRLADGREFKSPSSAGSAVMNGSACNGWRFWSVAGTEPKAAAKPKKGAAPGKKGGKAKKNPGGNGLIERLEDGRYFCNACMESFDAPEGVEPQGCPKGHTPD